MAQKDNSDFMILDNILFARRLTEACYGNGITQAALARATGIDEGVISYYFSGKKIPNLKTIHTIAQYLGVSIDYLVGNDEPVLSRLNTLRELFVHERGDKAREALEILDDIELYYKGSKQ